MNCDHSKVTTTYCGTCGKRVGYNRPGDLLVHLEKCAAQAENKVRDQGQSEPTKKRAKRDAEKWKAWAAWVNERIEATGMQKA